MDNQRLLSSQHIQPQVPGIEYTHSLGHKSVFLCPGFNLVFTRDPGCVTQYLAPTRLVVSARGCHHPPPLCYCPMIPDVNTNNIFAAGETWRAESG